MLDRSQAARLLGVSTDASPREVRRAFRQRARALHPDTSDVDDADIDLLTDARDLLLKPGPKPFVSPFPTKPAQQRSGTGTASPAPERPAARKIRYADDPNVSTLAVGCLPVLIAMMALFMLGFVALIFVLIGSPSSTDDSPVDRSSTSAECVRVSGSQAEAVACDSSGAQRVVSRSSGGATCPAGQNSLLVAGETWCLKPAG